MDELTRVSQAPEGLQFDRVEPVDGEAAAFRCAFCAAPLHSAYYEINGRAACETCRGRAEREVGAGPGRRGFLRAALAGCAAAAVGSGLYYGVRALTGYEIGFVAIVVGLLVGKAVRWGTQGRGGRVYQWLAVFLTYMAIASTYLPIVLQQIRTNVKNHDAAAQAGSAAGKAASKPDTAGGKLDKLPMGVKFFLAFGFLFAFAAFMPIVAGMKSPILLLIVGFGLWEAWKINRRHPLTITGPLQVGTRFQPAAAPGA